jgi:hypothetical protein
MSKETKEIKERLDDLEERIMRVSRRERKGSDIFDLLLDYLGLYLAWKPEQTTIMKKKKHTPK